MKPLSNFVKNKIKGRSFMTNRVYVSRLLQIEHFVIEGPNCMAGNMNRLMLLTEHPDEYLAIAKELRPEIVADIRGELDSIKRHRKDDDAAERDDVFDPAELAEWKKLGGTT